MSFSVKEGNFLITEIGSAGSATFLTMDFAACASGALGSTFSIALAEPCFRMSRRDIGVSMVFSTKAAKGDTGGVAVTSFWTFAKGEVGTTTGKFSETLGANNFESPRIPRRAISTLPPPSAYPRTNPPPFIFRPTNGPKFVFIMSFSVSASIRRELSLSRPSDPSRGTSFLRCGTL